MHAQIHLSQATYGIGGVSKVINSPRSKFLEIDRLTAPVSRNIEHIAAAKAEDVIQNLDFRGEEHQTNSTKKMFPFSCLS